MTTLGHYWLITILGMITPPLESAPFYRFRLISGWKYSRRSGSYHVGQGLAKRWAQFLEKYGDFGIDTPLSDAMAAFVNKHGTAKQKLYLQAQPPTETSDL